MLGMVCVDHSWAEFQDTDGRWRPLDPVFALLGGADLAGVRAAEFREFCAGSVPGRYLPWNRPAGTPLAEHTCGEFAETFRASPTDDTTATRHEV